MDLKSTAVQPASDRISRASFVSAGLLAVVGFMRLGSDMLTDANPSWASSLGDSWLRCLVRAASDGTLAGELDVQCFQGSGRPL